jgi:hypothetical protein
VNKALVATGFRLNQSAVSSALPTLGFAVSIQSLRLLAELNSIRHRFICWAAFSQLVGGGIEIAL